MAFFTGEMDPDAVLDFVIDWSDFLPADDTIETSTWTSLNEELVVDSNSHTDTAATVWLSMTAGVPSAKYTVTNHIVTTDGREDDRSLTIKCKEK